MGCLAFFVQCCVYVVYVRFLVSLSYSIGRHWIDLLEKEHQIIKERRKQKLKQQQKQEFKSAWLQLISKREKNTHTREPK